MEPKRLVIAYEDAIPILIAVDCIIFGFDQDVLKLLLFRRKIAPFKNEWSVIGSFVQPAESLEAAASRVLEDNTGLRQIYMEAMTCYSKVERDPGARVIAQPFFALIRLGEEELQTTQEYEARWFALSNVPKLILDHNEMVADALAQLRLKARHWPIGFELLPPKFTLPQLLKLYEAIYQRPLDRRNFRKKILSMNILDKLEEKDKTGSRKGAFLYQFNPGQYKLLLASGSDFFL